MCVYPFCLLYSSTNNTVKNIIKNYVRACLTPSNSSDSVALHHSGLFYSGQRLSGATPHLFLPLGKQKKSHKKRMNTINVLKSLNQ